MAMNHAEREKLILELTKQVTQRNDPPYAELRTALETLIDDLGVSQLPDRTVDWSAIVAEAVNLRPQH